MRFLNQAINLIPKNIRRRLFVMLGLAHRAMTLGVRIMVRDDEGRVLLVRHTYVAGWHFPGGAVDRGETAPQAAMKELNEECGIEADGSVVCPWHGYRFDVSTGASSDGRGLKLRPAPKIELDEAANRIRLVPS